MLNRDTGFVRDYGSNPHAGYDDIESPPYCAARNEDDDRLPPKKRVVSEPFWFAVAAFRPNIKIVG